MNKTIFDLSKLIPDFSLIINGEFYGGSGISAFFVILLISIAVLFFGYAVCGYLSAKSRTNFYIKLLLNIESTELANKQRDLRDRALENNKNGKLWKEFDESLVKSTDGERLFNTLDAAHFFNVSTLASGLTQNRLLAAVPGFLTAVGVVGTFVGLQLALSQLQLQQNAGVEELRDGIGSLINGASIAFMTSIWGVGTSLLFNFVEKLLERGVRKRIYILQNKIDHLFPRINAEQSLVSIADHSRSADETLQGLAEKIGDRLQEALAESASTFQTGIENSLNQIMSPAIQSLVSSANKGSELALEGLLTKFMDGVGEAGNSQRLMMEQASTNINNSMNSMGSQMQEFINQLDVHQENSKQLVKSQTEQMAERIQLITEASQQTLANTTEKTYEVLNNFQEKNQQQNELQQKLDQNRQSIFNEGIEKSKKSQEKILNRIDDIVKIQNISSEQLHEKLSLLFKSFKEVATENSKVSQKLIESSQQMNSVSNQLGILSTNVKQAAEVISSPIMQLMEVSQQVSTENKNVLEQSKKLLTELGQVNEQFGQVGSSLLQATEHAETGFTALDQHLGAFKQVLKMHIKDLEEELSTLLKGYSEQVQNQTYSRLNEWNEQTREYTTNMKDAVNTLASVIDEMETKSAGSYA